MNSNRVYGYQFLTSSLLRDLMTVACLVSRLLYKNLNSILNWSLRSYYHAQSLRDHGKLIGKRALKIACSVESFR